MRYTKIYEAFKPKADLLMNFQLCRAYLGDNRGVLDLVERILSDKFGGLHIKDRLYIRGLRGNRNPVIELPYHDFKGSVEEILAAYVELRFDKMVTEILAKKQGYPLTFRDIVERNIT